MKNEKIETGGDSINSVFLDWMRMDSITVNGYEWLANAFNSFKPFA